MSRETIFNHLKATPPQDDGTVPTGTNDLIARDADETLSEEVRQRLEEAEALEREKHLRAAREDRQDS